jgi:drug/metabolite transporter (DMT)-like permease
VSPDQPVAAVPALHGKRLWTGLALVVGGAVAYAITPAVVALGRSTVSLIDLLTYRAVITAAILTFVLAISGRGRTVLSGRPRRGVLIGATFLSADVLLFFGSLAYVETSIAVAIGFLYPTVVLILMAAFARRRPQMSELLLSLLALGGVAAMTLSSGAGRIEAVGLIMLVGCITVYSLYVLLANRLVQDTPPMAMAVQVQAGVALTVGTIGVLTGQLTPLGSPEAWRQVLLQSLLLAVAMTAYFAGLARLGPALASTSDTIQPAVALVAGAVLLGESVTAMKVVGVGMVITAIAAASLRERRSTGASITGGA